MPNPNESIQEYLARIRETVRKSREMVATAKAKLAETDKIYEAAGLTRGQVEELLSDPKLPPELRAKIAQLQNDWSQEVEEIKKTDYHPDQELEHRQEKLSSLKNKFRL